MAKISKQEKVLMHLQTHGSITPLEALIFNLRKEGHDIETNIVPKKGYAKYTYNVSK